MQVVNAMGITTNPLDQLDLVMLLKEHLPSETSINVVDDLEIKFGLESRDYCWRFGQGCEDHIDEWVEQMRKDGYVFEGSELFVDNMGLVAGFWANQEQETPQDSQTNNQSQEQNGDEEETAESEVLPTSATEISAFVMLTCVDEEGMTKRFKVRGKYRKHKDENVLMLVEMIDIDKDNDLNHEDIEAILEWTNNCNTQLLDFTIEGPAYKANQAHVHHFGLQRICLDNLHAVVLDRMISSLRETRQAIQLPQSPTELKIDSK